MFRYLLPVAALVTVAVFAVFVWTGSRSAKPTTIVAPSPSPPRIDKLHAHTIGSGCVGVHYCASEYVDTPTGRMYVAY